MLLLQAATSIDFIYKGFVRFESGDSDFLVSLEDRWPF